MLRPFERPDALRDLQSERRGAGGRSAPAREDLAMEQLQQGSPLALLQLPPHQHGLLRRSGGQLVFALRAHRQLRSVAHLMPENGLFSADQPLPGLRPQRHPGGGFDAASLHQPTLQTSFALSVSAVALSYPAALEARLLRQLHEDASAAAGGGAGGVGGGSIGARRQAGQGVAAAGHFRVVARRLVLGVHSGHVLCAAAGGRAAPQLLPLQEAPASTPAGTFPDARPADLRLRTVGGASVSVAGFALSAQHAVVLELELDVEETAVSRPAGSTTPGGAGGVRKVTVAWGCLLPYDAARRHLATGHLQLPLQFGARRAPLSGARLAAVLGPVVGGVEGGDAARATLELRAPPNWATLLPEIPERDARDAEEAGRREADAQVAAVGAPPPTARRPRARTGASTSRRRRRSGSTSRRRRRSWRRRR